MIQNYSLKIRAFSTTFGDHVFLVLRTYFVHFNSQLTSFYYFLSNHVIPITLLIRRAQIYLSSQCITYAEKRQEASYNQ
jgi:hypothetical protein